MAGESIGWGASFSLHNGATPGALVELVGVYELTPPNEVADDVEITHFKSPGKRREYIQGLIESGEGTFVMNYVPGSATDVLCQAARDGGETRAYTIVIPDAAGDPAWEIAGFCYAKGYERSVPVDDRMTATLTVKFTGAVSESVAS